MTEEESRQLKQENEALKQANVQKDQRVEVLEGQLMSALLRIEELERRLGKNSHNSSKPPSSDGFSRKRKQRAKSEKRTGGQHGHTGHALEQVALPDQVLIHRAK